MKKKKQKPDLVKGDFIKLSPVESKEYKRIHESEQETILNAEVLLAKSRQIKDQLWDNIFKNHPELKGKKCSLNTVTGEIIIL
jgi:hypothetical protein